MERMDLKDIYEQAWFCLSAGYKPDNATDIELMTTLYTDILVSDFSEILRVMKEAMYVMKKTDPLYIRDNDDGYLYKIFRRSASATTIAKELQVEFLPNGRVDYAYGYVEKALDMFDADNQIWVIMGNE
jgi:hypothetical protein